jgi:DNA-binding transcriptional LysR family regulator
MMPERWPSWRRWSMNPLRIAFDARLPTARFGALFQVICLEQPDVRLEWQPHGFPTRGQSRLADADVGLFVAPAPEPGLSVLTIETSPMMVAMAVGHRLGRLPELRVADILEEPFPGGPDLHAEWFAFWTLDERRGGPPRLSDDRVENAEQGLEVVAAGRAIATLPASLADGVAHPGVVAAPLSDGPSVPTCLVWRSDEENAAVHALIELATAMSGTRRDNGNQDASGH